MRFGIYRLMPIRMILIAIMMIMTIMMITMAIRMLKGSFTIFLFSVRTHILDSNEVWYS